MLHNIAQAVLGMSHVFATSDMYVGNIIIHKDYKQDPHSDCLEKNHPVKNLKDGVERARIVGSEDHIIY